MRRRAAPGPVRPVGSLYEKALLGVIVLFIVMVVTSIVITLTVPSPQTRYGLNLPNPTPPTTASPTRSPTPAPTTAPATGAPTGPPTVAPTAAPTFPAVAITCPNDVTVTLGSSLESTFTGGAATAVGGCSTPVVQYSDSIVGGSPTIFSRSSSQTQKKPAAPTKQVKENQQGTMAIPVELDSASLKMPVLSSVENDKKKRAAARSPSTPLSNLFLAATQSMDTPTQGTGLAVSPNWVVWATDSESIAVVDRTVPGTVVTSFPLSSLGTGNCSAALAGVSPQVAWDEEAQRWIMAHYSGVLSNVMCIYLSLTSDPAGPYNALVYANVTTTPSFRLAVWGRTYVITLDESTVPSKPLCVLDRESVLVWNDTLPLPGLFCGAALNPLTHLTYWTPLHAQVPPSPSAESSGAGTPGAVFMRAIDDEYQFGETLTPLTDQLEVEHWYNLNWTVGTYGVIRYKFSVLDFVQSPPNSACVPTPTGVFLNISYPGSLTPRLLYRRIPATGQESVVATLTSHCGSGDNVRFYWFELRWTTPTTMAFEPIWLLYQQGTSLAGVGGDDGLHKFLPAACMDANGTIAIGYSASNNQTVYPGLWATSRLGNDPNNTLRIPISLHEGAVGSVILTPNWGPHWSMACDPVGARWFYFSGAVSDLGSDRITWLDRIRVLGEIVERQWRADDYCGSSANCTQYITTV